jgi:hypothetical protein
VTVRVESLTTELAVETGRAAAQDARVAADWEEAARAAALLRRNARDELRTRARGHED